LIRLADRGLVEARWEDEQPVGRPRRHLYRLTPEGLAAAATAFEKVPSATSGAQDARFRGRLAERMSP
jgi:PadR family transcriptional regulator PadR